MKHKKPKKVQNIMETAPMQAAMEVVKSCGSDSDPQGSYTGIPKTPGETPVQDADDL